MEKKKRHQAIITHFIKHLPHPTTELHYRTPFELLVSVILSAQCTDKRVNQATQSLFKAFPTPEAMQYATVQEVYHHIRHLSYPHNKARYLVETSKMLVDQFAGQIPDQRAVLETLPGVGRKTANVILSTLYNKPAMAVDTHVMRVSKRLGLVGEQVKSPLAIERELVQYIPTEFIARVHHWLVLHGRYTCLARQPRCADCPFTHFCLFYKRDVKQ